LSGKQVSSDSSAIRFAKEGDSLVRRYDSETLILTPWGKDGMREAHERGTPVMRPLFYDFPEDARAWDIGDQYMFGPDLLVAPVMYEGMRRREVYFPAGANWRDFEGDSIYEGGSTAVVDAPLDRIPVFQRMKD